MTFTWKIEEKELRDDVRTDLSTSFTCRVFRVTSGDSGKVYWVQRINLRHGDGPPMYVCQCAEGYFHAPLTLLGDQRYWCKHARRVEREIEGAQG